MAEKHPYVSSGGPFIQTIRHLRDSFPNVITSDTLKKLGLAPKNESYVLNILRFLKIIDTDGNRTTQAQKIFAQHEDKTFEKNFSDLVKSSYADLFNLHGEKAWNLTTSALITFFRSSDNTSALVGKRQADTFHALAALSGYGEKPKPAANKTRATKKTIENQSIKKDLAIQTNDTGLSGASKRDFGLTVRVEINLPSDGNQETYDRIFKSIKENLLNE